MHRSMNIKSRPAVRPTQPPIQWVPGFIHQGIKQSRCKADHSLPPSAKVKNECSNMETPPYAFMECTEYLHVFTFHPT